MDKIIITNISSATVSLYSPELRLNRELIPGRSISLEKEVYQDLTFDAGFNSLVHAHYLKIDGLDEDEKVEESTSSLFSKADINKMLDELNITAFAKFIPTAAPAEKETVVDLAVEKGITNSAIVQLVKKYCNRDIIELISIRHQEDK